MPNRLQFAVLALLLIACPPVRKACGANATGSPDDANVSLSPVPSSTETNGTILQLVLRRIFSPIVEHYPAEASRRDLTFTNFFNYGWTQRWSELQEEPNAAPRFRLMRIQRAFWEREVRLTYNFAFRSNRSSDDEQEGEFELELPISRRMLIEIEGGAVAKRPSGYPWRSGSADITVIPEIMIAERRDLSFSSGLFTRIPTGPRDSGQGRTGLTPYLALWKDLGRRVGLHTYIGGEIPLAGYSRDAPDAVMQYALAPTITVTPRETPHLGDLTFFLEANGTTAVHGDTDGRTDVTLLPGARWLLCDDLWFALGYETPVTHAKDFSNRLWVSVYQDF